MRDAMIVSLERRNVLILAGAQALFQTTLVLVLTLSGVIGRQLAPRPGLATLPLALMVACAAATMVPASIFMQRRGRRAGFVVGTLLGAAAGATAAWAVAVTSFAGFIVACMLLGSYQGFAQFYRFAAADACAPASRARGISWVVAGGVAAAFAGPALARWATSGTQAGIPQAFVATAFLALVSAGLLTGLRLPAPAAETARQSARSLRTIASQPRYAVGLLCSTVGFSAMIMLMTATPMVMQSCGFAPGLSATVIQWHVLAMFAPSFFTGDLIRRFGVLRVIATGIGLVCAHVLVAVSGTASANFLVGLVLLGVGWNFMYVGGSALVAQCWRPAERASAQALHDLVVFAGVTAASFAAGAGVAHDGWRLMNLAALVALGVCAMALLNARTPVASGEQAT